jgi:multiple sugar transport system permease protein
MSANSLPSRADKKKTLVTRFTDLFEGKYFAWLLLAPSLAMIAFFIFYPLYRGLTLAFTHTILIESPDSTFVGLDNFRALFKDPLFWTSTRHTLIYLIIGLISQVAVGLFAAVLLSRERRMIWLIRLILVVPWFVPPVVTAYMWRFMLDPDFGIMVKLAHYVGLDLGGAGIWGDPNKTIYGILFVELWRSYPFFMLFFLAGIQGIPKDMRESTSVDGATALQHFRFIVLPLIKPVIFISSLLGAIHLINSPTLILLMSNGGPGDSTLVLPLYAFRKAFQYFDFGYASTISVAVLAAIAGFAMVYVRFIGFGKEE